MEVAFADLRNQHEEDGSWGPPSWAYRSSGSLAPYWPVQAKFWLLHLLWASLLDSVCDKQSCIGFPIFHRHMAAISVSLICGGVPLGILVCFPSIYRCGLLKSIVHQN